MAYSPKFTRNLTIAAAICTAAVMGVYFGWSSLTRLWPAAARHQSPPAHTAQSGLGAHDMAFLDLPARVVELNDIRTAKAKKPTQPQTLQLRGSLALDANRLAHVHSRFPGQVVQLATVEDPSMGEVETSTRRAINFMDRVKKGQKLAVLWSKDLGEKKSELVEALLRLRVNRQALDRLESLADKGATTERTVRDAEREVELSEIAVNRAKRTLRSWQLTDQEIEQVEAEAKNLHDEKGKSSKEQDSAWARVDVVAPIDGTIVEKNVVEGDIIDTDADLFKVADLRVLSVWAHAPEESLPYLNRMPRPVRWKIRLNSDPNAEPIPGVMDKISEIIDPNEHMALVTGLVPNTTGELRVGQFITTTIDLQPLTDVVEIPTRALVEDGDESIVLVQEDPHEFRYAPRRVSVERRYHDVVYVRSQLSAEQKSQGLQELHEGEQVVAAGALELKEALRKKVAASETAK